MAGDATPGEDARARETSGCVYLDATFGRGGHARALLRAATAGDRVIAIDRDPTAVAAGLELAGSEPRLTVRHARFSELAEVLRDAGGEHLHGAIMDLGVSSPQLDDQQRGFSFRGAGPIDMRMDPGSGEPAGAWLNRAAEAEIARVIRTLGEERHAGRIAAAIVRARPLETTAELAEVVRGAIPARSAGRSRRAQHAGSDPATRSFQAIRMHVNEELEEVETGIRLVFEHLRPGGRLAVISFHSLEDRLVKQSFRRLARGPELPRRLPVRAADAPAAGRLVGGPVRASAKEVADNPRSRSATLRVLERLA